jgi:hypothetical protein
MTGDADDMGRRLRLTLPEHWFADAPAVLEGVLAGFSLVWAGLYGFLQIVRTQSRLLTARDGFLDLASQDFFANRLGRRAGEADEAFRARIQSAMRRERGTRAGLTAAAADAGYTITVFEPARPADTGAYGVPGSIAWGVAGGWGSLLMPLECLVTAQPGTGADQATLRTALAEAMPAGGAAWLRVQG